MNRVEMAEAMIRAMDQAFERIAQSRMPRLLAGGLQFALLTPAQAANVTRLVSQQAASSNQATYNIRKR